MSVLKKVHWLKPEQTAIVRTEHPFRSTGVLMPTFIKSSVAGLAMIVGTVTFAYAQTPNVANLPPDGPRPGHSTTIPATPTSQVPASSEYVGPAPGAGKGSMPAPY